MKIVDTMSKALVAKSPLRRAYSAQFKAQVVQECGRRGASVAGVALSHGINANIVHRWLREQGGGALLVQPLAHFLPVTLDAPPIPSADIRVEVRRGMSAIVVSWPLEGASSCAAWLRDWLK